MTLYTQGDSNVLHIRNNCSRGHGEVTRYRMCRNCATGLLSQRRIYKMVSDGSDREFERFLKRYGPSGSTKEPAHVLVWQDKLEFSNSALDLPDVNVNYVNVFISDDNLMVALAPVSGGEVDRNSYSVSAGSISFQAIGKEIDVDLGFDRRRADKFEVDWKEDKGQFIIDFSAKKD